MLAPKIRLTAILIEDPKKGFTSFFAELPEIVVEGDTEEEAQLNLINTVSAVFEYKKHELRSENIPNNFIERPMVFELESV